MPNNSSAPASALALATSAACIPALIAYNLPPSSTFFNQAAALALWGGMAALAARQAASARGAAALLAALALAGALALVSSELGSLPASLALSAAGLVAAAAVMVWAGASIGQSSSRQHWLDAFFVAWLFAGVASLLVSLAQVFAPPLADGDWIARSGLPGRAVGNLRQPNHLASLLLWSAVAVVPLFESRRLGRAYAAALMAAFVFGITLSASRTGTVGVAVLAGWGLVDRRLSRPGRALLVAAPAFYALAWWAMTLWAADTHQTFGAAQRLAEHDLSASRFGIWRDTLALIAQQPWLGVGYGEFNFAWSLTPFPGRPVAFFDHTHNLPLQLIVEFGVPLGLLTLALLLVALWQAGRRAWRPDAGDVEQDGGAARRAAFLMVLLMAVHSLVEYPLWYAYFLLPTAWAWGVCLGNDPEPRDGVKHIVVRPRWLMMAGFAMIAGAGAAFVDYWRVVTIFAPGEDAAPLAQRIVVGQRSWFFAHHADYAAATTAEHPSEVMPAFGRASHYLLDTRLMLAWARAYAEAGDLDRARYLADRLREFHNPQSDEFFAECDDPARQPRPFQCEPASARLGWRDFR